MTDSYWLSDLENRKPVGIVIEDAPYEGYRDAILITENERDFIVGYIKSLLGPVSEPAG